MSAKGKLHVLVPVKDPKLGKTRLAPLLDVEERRALCLFLARRTLEICATTFGAERTIVVTSAPDIARLATEARLQLVAEDPSSDGLNAAITLGAEHARKNGAQALLVVPADLALVSSTELRAAADALPAAPGCLLVPDRRNCGTNLLGLAPMHAGLFAFGERSLQRHAELAARAGYEVLIHRSAALSLDLDLPEDYVAWRRGGAGVAYESCAHL